MVLWIGLKFPLSLGVLDSFYYSWWETFRLGNSIFCSTPPLFLLDTLCYTYLEKIETHPHSHNFYSIKMSEIIPFAATTAIRIGTNLSLNLRILNLKPNFPPPKSKSTICNHKLIEFVLFFQVYYQPRTLVSSTELWTYRTTFVDHSKPNYTMLFNC